MWKLNKSCDSVSENTTKKNPNTKSASRNKKINVHRVIYPLQWIHETEDDKQERHSDVCDPS